VGGRLVAGPFTKSRTTQPACPTIDAATRLVECNWAVSHTLSAQETANFTSGVFLAKLTAAGGKQNYIIFVVRDDARASDVLFQSAVTTYAAYNNWGGADFYDDHSVGGKRAYKVSLNRPYAKNPVTVNQALGVGDFFEWEIHMARFLEKNGYDVSYSTNIDTHVSPSNLLKHRAFLSVGHDEYYTREMYNAVQMARDKGINLGFFGANNIYWQTRLEASSTGQPNRTVVSYKRDYKLLDPMFKVNASFATGKWRDTYPLPNRHESALMGVGFIYNSIDALDMVISDCSSFYCAGTGLKKGDILPGLLGYEVDAISPSSPANVKIIATSPFVCTSDTPECLKGQTLNSNMTYYETPIGSVVFATGSMNWNWGVNSFGPDVTAARYLPSVEILTRNVINSFVQ
jgi:hypothetical protein